MPASADVIVVGGGVIGLSAAWVLRRSGRSVVLIDPAEGESASLVAAGMLAPVTEATFGEEPSLRLNLLAATRFPEFASELEVATGFDVGLRREGTLTVAYDAGDRAAVARLADLRRSYGLEATDLDARECRRLEPLLSPDVRSGVLAVDDWSVDNRRLLTALRHAVDMSGVEIVIARVARIDTDDSRVRGVTLKDGSAVTADNIVLACGAWSAGIDGVPEVVRTNVRPVKGQLLRLRVPAESPLPLTHTVHATVRGRNVYVVPRADGEVVVGATSEERGFDRTVTAAGVHDLLRDATAVLPVVGELIMSEMCVGLRPATRDNLPIVASTDISGLIVATGHYRNGILQSAITADAVLALSDGREPAGEWQSLRPAAVGVR